MIIVFWPGGRTSVETGATWERDLARLPLFSVALIESLLRGCGLRAGSDEQRVGLYTINSSSITELSLFFATSLAMLLLGFFQWSATLQLRGAGSGLTTFTGGVSTRRSTQLGGSVTFLDCPGPTTDPISFSAEARGEATDATSPNWRELVELDS
ncbi:hypothetical protein NP493_50g03017 [Ridgeia piscesae]|uniref:Uncharacterized protein n=1 Tax=Ridgeia piscesae TaxID=27915 RepID=A0AAD9UJA8_RIDPI|nr:hypothetical protein NP493_50g03017 [Ridgeia piscesae]